MKGRGPAARCHDHMNVLRPRIHDMQMPVANPAVVRNGLLDNAALFLIQDEFRFGHQPSGRLLQFGIW